MCPRTCGCHGDAAGRRLHAQRTRHAPHRPPRRARGRRLCAGSTSEGPSLLPAGRELMRELVRAPAESAALRALTTVPHDMLSSVHSSPAPSR